MEFFATCPKGFEHLLAGELSSFGIPSVRPLKGQVAFSGDLGDAYVACLWSHLASRVMLVLGRIEATDADALYEGVASIPWEDHLVPDATFAVDAHGTNQELRNTRYVALHAKDAIVDRMVRVTGTRPEVDTERPGLVIAVRVGKERATVALDLSGEPLFRRGYSLGNRNVPVAPLRPDYAAALLEAGAWYRNCRHESPTLVSLYSGVGTVLAEAALEALDQAPGLRRRRWGFDRWAQHDQTAWDDVVATAHDRADAAHGTPIRLVSLETRPGTQQTQLNTLRSAGLGSVPTSFVGTKVLGDAIKTLEQGPLVVGDLSWIDPGNVAQEAEALGTVSAAAQAAAKATGLALLSPDDLADSAVGTKAAQVEDVLVGSSSATIRSFEPEDLGAARPMVTLKNQTTVPVFVPASDQFAARLQKNARLRAKWAKREDVTCYRVYDSDLPDYAVSIDLYQAATGKGRWLYISEYRAPKEIDPALAHERLMDVLAIAPKVLGVASGDVYLRIRSHGRGGAQYADKGKPARRGGYDDRYDEGYEYDGYDYDDEYARPTLALPPGAHLIDEGGLTFEVNFENRLDCGIFLDHRETRSLLREMAKDTYGSKRFLNLFAYTGTATCYAADGGMHHTTTVDMSRPSLEWAERNMARNGFTGPDHEFVQADVIDWISEQRHTRNRWDLIFCDTPTFSNSSRMHHGSWDVQRDHAELLIGVSRLLIEGGQCVFSCNLRSFKPDVEYLNRYGVEIEDITPQTIPEDFKRNPKVHHTYLVWRTPR